jgi:DNA-binding CsgD family transcriptional regulator
LETREQELDRLIREQAAEDNSRQAPQRFGAGGSEPVLSTAALGIIDVADALDGETVNGHGLGESYGEGYDEATGPRIAGKYRQQRLGTIWALTGDDASDAEAVVRKAVEDMTDAQRETYRLIYGERLSFREAADELGIDVSSVRDRVETLKRIVTRALVQASGGEAE